MNAQQVTLIVVTQQDVLTGLDNLSNQLLGLIKSEPDMSEALEIKLREVDRQVSSIYCAIRFGQPAQVKD